MISVWIKTIQMLPFGSHLLVHRRDAGLLRKKTINEVRTNNK